MSKKHNIFVDGGTTVVEFRNSISYPDVVVALKEVSQNYSYERRLLNLGNHRLILPMGDLKNIVTVSREKFINKNRAAFVSLNEESRGTLRVFQALQGGPNRQVGIFYSVEEANNWLNLPL